jgi:hypothetical protein
MDNHQHVLVNSTDSIEGKEAITVPDADDDATDRCGSTSTVTIGKKKLPKLNWTRLNHSGSDHDNRRLVAHRATNCQCEVCYRELNKLPPDDPIREKFAARKIKLEDREVRRAKKKAKMEVKAGKQACIRNFFRY